MATLGYEPPLRLENGDRLSKAEFLKRWNEQPSLNHAELLEGIVHLNAAAIRCRDHGEPQYVMMRLLGTYCDVTPHIKVMGPSSIDLDDENFPEPDVVMYSTHPRLAQTKVDHEGYLVGPPELIVEIAASTASVDLHVKKDVYERAGVKEYLVWRTIEAGLDWFVLENGLYVRNKVDPADGFMKSRVFPGLWIKEAVLLKMDVKQILASMQEGITSAAHQEFCEQQERD